MRRKLKIVCLRFLDTPKNSKVIVVDNNSNDKTVQVIKEKFPEIDLIESKENLDLSSK